MKFPIKTSVLRDAIRTVSYVAANTAIESSQYVKCAATGKVLQFSLSGDGIGTATIPTPLTGFTLFLDRKPLLSFLENTQSETTNCLVENDVMHFIGGHQKLKLTSHTPIGGYAQWDKSKASALHIPDECRPDLSWLAQYAALGPPMEHLTMVRAFKGYGLLGTDTLAIAARMAPDLKSDFQVAPLIAKLLGDKVPVDKMLTDDRGVGATMAGGYVYQPLLASKLKYPLKALQDLVASCLNTKPVLRFKAQELLAGLKYLGQFEKVENAICKASGKFMQISTQFASGEAHTNIACTGGNFTEKWEVARLTPFLEHLVEGTVIGYSTSKNAHQFQAKSNKHQYALILVKQ